MKEILKIEVELTYSYSVKSKKEQITALGFTAAAKGEYFSGKTAFEGCDTQRTDLRSGKTVLSARYMLVGTDFTGQACSLFIENNGDEINGFHPEIVTDSKALSFLNEAKLTAKLLPKIGGVIIKIYAEK